MVPQEIQNNKPKHPLLKYGYLGPDEQVRGSLSFTPRSSHRKHFNLNNFNFACVYWSILINSRLKKENV